MKEYKSQQQAYLKRLWSSRAEILCQAKYHAEMYAIKKQELKTLDNLIDKTEKEIKTIK